MTERLGPPDTARFPALSPRYVLDVPVGTPLGRIYAAGGLHPATWGEFRSYGPVDARFDHQPPPAHTDTTRHVMYVSAAIPDRHGNIYPLLQTCLAEVFRDRGVVELRRDYPYFTVFNSTRELRLLDLSDSDWLTVAGGNSAITSGPRRRARLWARAIYEHYGTGIDGLVYAPSNVAPARAVALWEQARNTLPGRPSFNEPLSHVGLRPRVETYAGELGLAIV